MRHSRVVSATVLLLVACGETPTDPIGVDSVEVEGPSTMTVGEVAQAVAFAFDQNGDPILEPPVVWSSSDEMVVTVDGSGLLTALTAGTTTIAASVDDIVASFELEVQGGACTEPVGTLTVGETVEGELTEASCFLEDWFHDPWILELTNVTAIQIDLASDDFAPVLILTDQTGAQLGLDAGSGDGDDARLSGTLGAGSYVVWASTAEEAAIGRYELTVGVAPVEGAASALPSPARSPRPRAPVP